MEDTWDSLLEQISALQEENKRLRQSLTHWEKEIAQCDNCHYHRHISLGLTPYYGKQATWCDECVDTLENPPQKLQEAAQQGY